MDVARSGPHAPAHFAAPRFPRQEAPPADCRTRPDELRLASPTHATAPVEEFARICSPGKAGAAAVCDGLSTCARTHRSAENVRWIAALGVWPRIFRGSSGCRRRTTAAWLRDQAVRGQEAPQIPCETAELAYHSAYSGEAPCGKLRPVAYR